MLSGASKGRSEMPTAETTINKYETCRNRRAFTRTEAIVCVVCVVLLFVVLIPILLEGIRGDKYRGNKQSRDASQIRGINQSWLVFAREFDDAMPTPGLMNRLPVDGTREPGRGEEDVAQNTTANLHSMCIMQNFYSAELCVSPSEPNPAVRILPSDEYNFELYKPASSSYWDPALTADLKTGSNVSYASMPIHGRFRDRQWRETLDGHWPILGNRGPLNGVHDPNSFTLKIHAPFD